MSHVSTASSNHKDSMGNGELESDPAPSLFQTSSARRNINLSTKVSEITDYHWLDY